MHVVISPRQPPLALSLLKFAAAAAGTAAVILLVLWSRPGPAAAHYQPGKWLVEPLSVRLRRRQEQLA